MLINLLIRNGFRVPLSLRRSITPVNYKRKAISVHYYYYHAFVCISFGGLNGGSAPETFSSATMRDKCIIGTIL